MIFLYWFVGASCFISILNLVAVLFLSNAFFRLMVRERDDASREPVALPRVSPDERGLVDIGTVDNYDPRFRSAAGKS